MSNLRLIVLLLSSEGVFPSLMVDNGLRLSTALKDRRRSRVETGGGGLRLRPLLCLTGRQCPAFLTCDGLRSVSPTMTSPA